MVVSTDAVKALDKIEQPFMMKKHSTSWNRRECPQYNKGPL